MDSFPGTRVAALTGLSVPFLVWGLCTVEAQQTAGPKEVSLLTDVEASELRVTADEWDPVPRARSAPLGPIIVVRAPDVKLIDGNDTIEAHSPTNLEVIFQENQAPINMASLEVKAKKGPFSKSLTDRLKPFLHGTTLVVENMDVPSGKFQIQIFIEDDKGQETAQTYRLIVQN